MTEAMQEQQTEATSEAVVADQQTEQVQQDTPVEPEVAAPVQTDDAAFQAGFNEVQGVETPAPEVQPEPEPKLIAGMTEDQVKELLAKAAEVDKLREQQAKVFGTLGSLKQSIDALRSAPKPSQAQVQLTKEKLGRLSKEFPEMAEMLAQDLNEVLGSASAAEPVDVQRVISQSLEPQLQQMQQQMEAKVLTAMHPDWKKTVASPEFSQWTQTLPEDVRNELGNSWDAEFIGTKLSEFKDFKGKTAVSQQSKQRRLEAAITPKGQSQPTSAQTEMDAFMSGFKQARGIA